MYGVLRILQDVDATPVLLTFGARFYHCALNDSKWQLEVIFASISGCPEWFFFLVGDRAGQGHAPYNFIAQSHVNFPMGDVCCNVEDI
jgi:hypothetical protein